GAGLSISDTPEIKTHAAALAAMEKAGELANCYRLICGFQKVEAQAVAVAAGHSVIATTDRAFWKHLQAQIAEACRRRCDGWQLR
ncbi:hypothetical protein, partial [Xanthomonas citri]|uniref:hypothetical protein n=1 Tax=Xanthomonas citri TaxID=346 RepID=UPI000528431D